MTGGGSGALLIVSECGVKAQGEAAPEGSLKTCILKLNKPQGVSAVWNYPLYFSIVFINLPQQFTCAVIRCAVASTNRDERWCMQPNKEAVVVLSLITGSVEASGGRLIIQQHADLFLSWLARSSVWPFALLEKKVMVQCCVDEPPLPEWPHSSSSHWPSQQRRAEIS